MASPSYVAQNFNDSSTDSDNRGATRGKIIGSIISHDLVGAVFWEMY